MYTSNMDVGIRELRSHLSDYLDEVKSGHEVVITERGRPVARIVPVQAGNTLDQLVSQGLVRAPLSPKRRSLAPPIKTNGSVVELLVEESW